MSDWTSAATASTVGPIPDLGAQSIVIKWNRNYETYIAGYRVYAGIDRSNCTTFVAQVNDPNTISLLHQNSANTTWYKIVPIYGDGTNTWDGSDVASQYFSKSLIPEIKITAYQDVIEPGGVLDVYLGANVPSTTYTITIATSTGTVLTTGSITTNSDGYGSTQITIPATASGTYYVSTTVAGTSYSDPITVTARGKEIVRQLEEDILLEFQEIKVHNEGLIESNLGNTIFKFAFKNWNKDIEPEFFLGGTAIHSLIPYIDYDAGVVGMHGIDTQDLFANYAFKFFTQLNLYDYAVNVCNQLNLIKPFTEYTIDSMPTQWDPIVLIGSYRWAMRKLLQSLIFRDMRLATIGDGAVGLLQGLMTDATSSWEDARKDAKRRGMINPAAVISGRYRVPMRVTGINWANYVGIVST